MPPNLFCLPLLLTAAVIVIGNAVFNAFAAVGIHPAGGEALRLSINVVTAALETAILFVVASTIRKDAARAQAARHTAEIIANELKTVVSVREAALAESTMRAGEARTLFDRFEIEIVSSIDSLYEAAQDLLGDTDRLGATAARASAQAVMVSVASEDTARRAELAAQAAEELSRTIDEVGSSASQSSSLANAAVVEAERTNATMDEMAAVAAEINSVTEFIIGIAAQTNLLALNATIEAARAGDAGRGFSVVAQEVKALASQTAAASNDIAIRIGTMQNTAERSVAAIHAISGRIRELNGVVIGISAAVEEQGAATASIAANVASAAVGVGHVEKSIAEIEAFADTNTCAVAEMSAAANRVASQTQAIRERIRTFAEDVGRMRA